MVWIINGIIVILFVLFITRNFLPAEGVTQISTADLKKIVRDRNYQFIDVRTPMEFKGNHIKGFKNIPVHEINQRYGELKKDKTVVLICATGSRSNRVARMLKKLGFKQIMNVRGGMSNWM